MQIPYFIFYKNENNSNPYITEIVSFQPPFRYLKYGLKHFFVLDLIQSTQNIKHTLR